MGPHDEDAAGNQYVLIAVETSTRFVILETSSGRSPQEELARAAMKTAPTPEASQVSLTLEEAIRDDGSDSGGHDAGAIHPEG